MGRQFSMDDLFVDFLDGTNSSDKVTCNSVDINGEVLPPSLPPLSLLHRPSSPTASV